MMGDSPGAIQLTLPIWEKFDMLVGIIAYHDQEFGENKMDYSKIVEELKDASLFDLYRLRVAIEHLLENPQRIKAIKRQLRPGQDITYFDRAENRLIEAKVIKLKRTRLLVENKHDNQRWDIPFHWVNLDNVNTDIEVSPKVGLDKSQLKIGDEVGFLGRQDTEVYGEVIRLNQKTATVLVDEHEQWRVPYGLLFSVIDGERVTASKLIEGTVIKKE